MMRYIVLVAFLVLTAIFTIQTIPPTEIEIAEERPDLNQLAIWPTESMAGKNAQNTNSVLGEVPNAPTKVVWRVPQNKVEPFRPREPLVAAGGIVLYRESYSPDNVPPPYNLVALDANTGIELWRFQPDKDLVTSYSPEPVISGDVVYVSVTGESTISPVRPNTLHIYALNKYSGEEIWSFEWLSFGSRSPVLSNGLLLVTNELLITSHPTKNSADYVIEKSFVHMLDAKTGEELRRHTLPQYRLTEASMSGDTLFVGGNAFDDPDNPSHVATSKGLVNAVDWWNGRLLWSGRSGNSASGRPVIHRGTVLGVSDQTSTLAAFDQHTGKAKWSFRIGSVSGEQMAAAEGLVVLGRHGPELNAYDIDTGDKLWKLTEPSGHAFRRPLIVGSTIIVTATQAMPIYNYTNKPATLMHAVDLQSGDILWTSDKFIEATPIADTKYWIGADEDGIYLAE